MNKNQIIIDINKIINNIQKIKSKTKSSSFCAVIKADAYGLGQKVISEHIESYVDYFAVARVKEAKSLRNSGIKKPILVLGPVNLDEIDDCLAYDIEIPIYDLEFSKEINKIAKAKLKCHLAIDTGHSRIGFRDFEIEKIRMLKEFENLHIIGTFTHFSTADEQDRSFTDYQYQIYKNLLAKISEDFDIKISHVSNTAASLDYDYLEDMVRVGIGIYGVYPSDYMHKNSDIDLEICFKFESVVSFVKTIEKNTPISYGRTFVSEKEMRIATIPIGYADGYHRSFSNVGEVKINGKMCRVVGRVCMDQMMVDVTGVDVRIGDRVLLYPDIYKEAKKIDTISYELMTSLAMRLERVYIYEGEKIEVSDYIGEIYED